MFGLLIFGFILFVGLSLISRPFRWHRRRTSFGRGWGFGEPMRFEGRREYGQYQHHHHHGHGGWNGGHHSGGHHGF